MARGVLADLGEPATGLLEADRASIWSSRDVALDVDLERHVGGLMAALGMRPGSDRDDQLVAALAEKADVLVDEPYADWALRPGSTWPASASKLASRWHGTALRALAGRGPRR